MFVSSFSRNKIHFVSLGCARNLVDSEVMLGILMKAGYEVVENSAEADFLVVNTCGFLAKSRDESCDTIGSLFKEKKKDAKVIVAGCMVQNHSEEIKAKFPNVHYFLGSGDVEKILEAVQSDNAGEGITSAKSYLQTGEIPRQISTPKHYAYLKIAEGCAKRCSFCVIPDIKGVLRSKPMEQVVKEFKLLLDQGVKEVILIAQDLGDYAKDRKEKDGLESLLKEMLKVEKDFWLRLLYLYPDEITDGLIEIMQSDPRICPYLDMPIQHINDRILKSMRRKTDGAQIRETLEKLRKQIPNIVIRTSLMVGFPGETEEEFEELLTFIQKYPLDNVGIFTYSKEEGSFSAKLAGHLPEEVKQERFEKLASMQKKMVKKRNKRFLGQKYKVVVEGYHPETDLLMVGRFYGQCPEIDGQVIINDGRKVDAFGEWYEVEITEVAEYDLIGRVVKSLSPKAPKKTSPRLAVHA
ncbi:MAG: 30S ribosomal protein S12 methylthiotransferase RimO [Chlamydiae bacterium]|jgi:ribosomal protein S12 methylthiotransferase|nr:30S ribosomal protein S12 methylthiotransferase RimO [Chlamydiota bacterium]